jgi:hypothetical protein
MCLLFSLALVLNYGFLLLCAEPQLWTLGMLLSVCMTPRVCPAVQEQATTSNHLPHLLLLGLIGMMPSIEP